MGLPTKLNCANARAEAAMFFLPKLHFVGDEMCALAAHDMLPVAVAKSCAAQTRTLGPSTEDIAVSAIGRNSSSS